MSLESFTTLCNKYQYYNFDTPEDYDKWIDYDGKKISKNKYVANWLIKNTSWIPTDWQGYGLK